ncbi:MAG: tRNA lysidine(34) synthetase TilS [Eisenbergiella massiliensis]
MVLRTRQPGDYLSINDKLQKKRLKDYLIQEKIPVQERENLLLLADGSHILWVVGHRISSAVKVTDSTKRVLRVHIRGGGEDG